MQKPIVAAIGLLLAAPALRAQQPVSREIPVDQIVAIVGAKPILYSNVIEAVNARRAQGMKLPADSVGQAAMMRRVVDELIDEEVLVQKAKDEKVVVADADIATGVEQQIKRVRTQFQNEEEFRTELKKAGFGTPEEYRRSLTDEARRSAMQQQLISKLKADGKLVTVGVSEAEVNKAYEDRKADMPKRPSTVTFRQVIVATKPSQKEKEVARVKAESLLAEIRRGGDFEKIAKRESMDASKEQGGDLGWNRRGGFLPEFERVAFAMGPGQVSPVVQTAYGFHIIRVDRVQPAEVKVRHILIRPASDSADVIAARAEADTVAEGLRRGMPYDTLAKKHHDPFEERGALDPFDRSQLPVEYAAALEGKKGGDIVGPFRIDDKARGVPKFVVVALQSTSDGGEYTVDDLRQRLRDQLSQEKAMRRMLDQLRRSTYVAVRI